jgi:hypothetical protein
VKRPTASGCLGALIAVAIVAAALSVPGSLAESPVPMRIETFISSACGGPSPCPTPEKLKRVGELERVLAQRMPDLPEDDRTRLADAIYQEAKEGSLDPLLVLAVIAVESGFDHVAESERGAVGLMQLRPATLRNEAERSGLEDADPDDPIFNVRAGVRYFRRLLRAFGSTELALMAYNAGPNRILHYLDEEGEVPERFLTYPRKVQGELKRLRRGKPVPEIVLAEKAQPKPPAPDAVEAAPDAVAPSDVR